MTGWRSMVLLTGVGLAGVVGACRSADITENELLGVLVEPASAQVDVNDSIYLLARVTGPPGILQSVVWRSRDPTVASANGAGPHQGRSAGVILGLSAGTARIEVLWQLDTTVFGVADILVNVRPVDDDQDGS